MNHYYRLIVCSACLGFTVLMSACDRTEPEQAAKVPTVDIEQSEPLQAGNSVGSADIDVVATSDVNSDQCIDLSQIDGDGIVTNLVEQPVQGSPQSTVQDALNTLYYGCAEDAAIYYNTQIANFADELTKTQPAFKKTVQKVILDDVSYSTDGNTATVTGRIGLVGTQQMDTAEFILQNVDGQWKILG